MDRRIGVGIDITHFMSVKHIVLIKEVGHEDRCLIKTFISIPNFSRAFPSLINIFKQIFN